jgi:hypothetical protein
MASQGQTVAHFPQNLHLVSSTKAQLSTRLKAPKGHWATHAPHPTHVSLLIFIGMMAPYKS